MVNGNQITISGTPSADISVTTVYPFTVTTSGGSCADASLSGTITVDPEGAAQLTSGAGTDTQTICEQTAIQDITYLLVDGATGATITGLPPGLNFNVNAGIVTIFGTPTVDVTTPTTYNYTLTTTGGACPGTATGTITINPDDELTQTSAIGTESQVLCEGASILDITYTFSGGATGATVTGLPAGVTFVVNGNQITISGTPIGPFTSTTVFPFSVESLGSGCNESILNGTITIGPSVEIIIDPTGGSDNQVICEGDALQDIIYTLSETNVALSVTGLPAGVFYTYSGNILTISGIPTDNVGSTQSYSYVISTIGQECDNTITGSITVNPDDEINLISGIGTENQSVCMNTSIEDIVYELDGGSQGATVSGLPAGVSYNLDNSTGVLLLSITGTPTGPVGLNPFTITTFGFCSPVTQVGNIEIIPEPIINHEPSSGPISQEVCQYNQIEDIVYTINNALAANVTGLPPGCEYSYLIDPLTNNIELTIFGSPTSLGVYDYVIDAFGTNCSSQFIGSIEANEGSYFELISDSNTENQIVCDNEPINPIVYQLNGSFSTFNYTGLPNGIEANLDSTTNIVTISGIYNGPTLPDLQFFNFTLYSLGSNGCLGQYEGQLGIYPSISITDPVTVNEISSNPSQTEIKNIYCNGESDGAIKLVLEGGSPSTIYSVQWTGPNSFSSSSLYIDNLVAGIYTVSITDISNNELCGAEESYEIIESAPLIIDILNVTNPSCDNTSSDGQIQINVSGGNPNLLTNIDWYLLDSSNGCFSYSLTPYDFDLDNIPDYADADLDQDGTTDTNAVDSDNDGIKDSVDSDIDGDGTTDPGSIDLNNDGIDDVALVSNITYFDCDIAAYQSVDLFNSSFIGSELNICAGLNTVLVTPSLDEDQDPSTPDIPAIKVIGGDNSCNAGVWELLPQFSGFTTITDLNEGVYRVVVSELDANLNIVCSQEEIFDMSRNLLTYDNLTVDSELCSFNPGYIVLDVFTEPSDVFFYYNDQLIDLNNVEILSSSQIFTTYSLFIENPVENGSLEIINEYGCGILVDEFDILWSVPGPEIDIFSPEFEQFGVISTGSFINFESVYQAGIEAFIWDFGDGSSLEFGPNVSHAYNLDGTYEVILEVFSSAGCSLSTSITVEIGKGYSIMLPNVFTPNGDNFNDLFRPLFTGGITQLDFQVFDPDGHELYYEQSSTDQTTGQLSINGWNGENAKSSESYYVYKVLATLFNGEEITKTGLFRILK